jgi:hypothetical protein
MEVCETTLEVLEMENPDIVACGFGEGRGGDIQPSFLEAIRGSFTQWACKWAQQFCAQELHIAQVQFLANGWKIGGEVQMNCQLERNRRSHSEHLYGLGCSHPHWFCSVMQVFFPSRCLYYICSLSLACPAPAIWLLCTCLVAFWKQWVLNIC